MGWMIASFKVENINQQQSEVEILNNLVLGMHPKKSKSSLWCGLPPAYPLRYQVLIPKLSEQDVLILKDFGYKIEKKFISRRERREYYVRLKK